MHGLKQGILQFSEYDPEWVVLFSAERERILSVVSELIADMQHIGSTAVPGLRAKPIIDIGIHMKNGIDPQQLQPGLNQIGIRWRNKQINPGHFYAVKDSNDLHLFHYHIFEHDAAAWHEHIHFRDALLANDAIRDEYAAQKLVWAKESGGHRPTYVDLKTDFITRHSQPNPIRRGQANGFQASTGTQIDPVCLARI